jgi:hypothetical protein
LTVKPISNAAGPTARNPPPMELRNCLSKATKLSSSMTAAPETAAALGTWNSSP